MFNKCRACLGLRPNMKLLTEDEPEGKQLISMFTSLNNFEWISNEKVASYLCGECEAALTISYEFRKKCLESHEIITKQLEAKTENEEEENCVTQKWSKSRIEEFSSEAVEQAITQYRQRHKEMTYRCMVCPYVLSTLPALSSHMSQNHKDVRENWCHLCNQSFYDLPKHRETHKGLTELCPFCNKHITKRYYIDHLRMHSSNKPFHCRFCSRGFLTQSSLEFHYGLLHADKYATEEEENKIQEIHLQNVKTAHNYCEKCDRRVRSLTIHMRKLHQRTEEGPTRNICYICTREMKSAASLKAHLKVHEGATPHKCTYCGKPHKNRAQLIEHERTHTGEKPHICNVCNKGFAQAGALGTHMKLHTGRPEECSICQKRFCRPSELKLHLRKHSGEKPFLCTECGKAFIQKSHLMEHMKTHSDVRPFQCMYCEKAFKQKSLLNSHLQIHSGHKPYQCKLCEYSCFKSYRLQQHMKLHDNDVKKEKGHVCPVCQKGFTTQAMFNAHVTASHNAIL